ncbi:MAG: DNA helicase RecQ [Betaproteobacteria bacterium]|nr:DNA helicase RecQ [Betaproteobacteria bacterium]
MQSLHILREVFGYREFRGEQKAVVDHVIAGGDCLVLMPTGGGKSLCYQIPSLVRAGTGIVVSPLIALMQDQVDALLEAGVRAAFLNSSMTSDEANRVERSLRAGELDLLYLAPERLLTEQCLQLLARSNIALFAIDEAHCVSQWGHDFRPEYIQLAVIRERFPGVPRMALTATADSLTRNEIVDRLALDEPRIFTASFDRPNIRYRIVEKDNPRKQLLAFLRDEHEGDVGIVYCLSRAKVDETADMLVEAGLRALPYHAGMPSEQRRLNQTAFLREDGVIMVATIAFGMGIDKPDVRFVAHLDLPKSVESYYQETGRAGRDGLPADAWMTYGLADVVQQRRMIDTSEANDQYKRVAIGKLDALLGLCETSGCRRERLLDYFGETSKPCGNCDNCLVPPRTWDGTEAAQKALSCIYRTGQRFGALHVIDVLLGNETPRVREWGHQHLSTFGIGKALSQQAWRGVLRQLLAMGYLSADLEGYGGLRLTESSRPILKGTQTVMLREHLASKPAGRKSKSRRDATVEIDDSDLGLWEALRSWRAKTAREHNVPAYVIMHDATLKEIVRVAPGTLDELSEITGMGVRKVSNYGADLLRIVERSG